MNANLLTASPAWTAAGWTMLHLLWVGTAIGLASALLRRLLRSARPELRYAIAMLGLASLAITPLAIFAWVFEPTAVPNPVAVSPISGASPTGSVLSAKVRTYQVSERPSRTEASTNSYRRSFQARLDWLAVKLPWAWLAGAPLNLVLLVAGLVGVERIRRSSRVVEAVEIPRRCRMLADSLGIARRVGVAVCDRIAAPILIGVVRPLILLPPAAISGWSVEQLEMVLLHELAHLKRWDNLVNLLQRFVESLLFFHPAAWWLSGWVRLERELCCDRLVVARMGRPEAYVELLVALAGAHRGGRTAVPVLAMADRQITTRIRRILNMEDRSMKLTMPEGLGLAGAMLVGVSLVLGIQAAPPKPSVQARESLRMALRKAAGDTLADPGAGAEAGAMKLWTLVSIGEAQLKLGDRAAGLETLRRASEACERFDFKENALDGEELFGVLPELARIQREAGDLAGARSSLDRATKLAESLEGFSRVELLQHLRDGQDTRREEHELGPAIRSGLFASVAKERIALGDRDAARELLRRSLDAVRSSRDGMSVLVLTGMAPMLFKAGESSQARAMIDEARRTAKELTNAEARDGMTAEAAEALADIGDLDGALDVARTIGGSGRRSAFRSIIESLAEAKSPEREYDPYGITQMIGTETLQPKDRDAARRDLPKIARVVRGIADPLLQLQCLAMIAHLQARAGDFAAARQTADAIPDVRHRDFPGLTGGFYEAVKPSTLASIAGMQAEAGERVAASEGFDRAAALSRAIAAADQKIAAQVVIARNQLGSGSSGEARRLVREGIDTALAQAEPLRSRGLAMFAELQGKAEGLPAAARTVEVIRDYPPFEKVKALQMLADGHASAGDDETAKGLIRQALRYAEAKEPEGAPARMGKSHGFVIVAGRQLIDLQYEFEPRMAEFRSLELSVPLRVRLGEVEEAVRKARSFSGRKRDFQLEELVRLLGRNRDFDGAFRLAASLETSPQRLEAMAIAAGMIGDR
ncbi:MAG: M56 family metallopeptidase [Isosphaeraceae bacterium]